MISEIWSPEISMEDEEITALWKLKDVHKNQEPIGPEQVVIQLNGLYTLPEGPVPKEYEGTWAAVEKSGFTRIADYDHPVNIFCPEDEHELLKCLKELNNDMAFEKERKIISKDWKVPILVSISLTHPEITDITGDWLRNELNKLKIDNILPLIMTEKELVNLKNGLYSTDFPNFTVRGKYANHFNALKYTQLILEKGWGIRAGFKLDTDEGIRTKDLYQATGKTWMETLCHPYWGGRAKDKTGKKFFLDINEGEYIDSRDIDRLGYTGSLREPDVKLPDSRLGKDLFFQKQVAHSRATALYNTFDVPEDFISHPVVKGGGYGITNEGLKRSVPFAYSRVGRAEDQAFYFSALARNSRGIFHPDLRIAHYKSSVAVSEDKTEGSRFLGDIYRILLFRFLAVELGIKKYIDPMPGVFCGELARAQAVFHLLYRTWHYYMDGKDDTAREILQRGLVEHPRLKKDIDSGETAKELHREFKDWEKFIRKTGKLEDEKVREILEKVFL